MSMGTSRFPDPYQSRTDISHATVFLIVLLLIIAIGAILFFGNAWVFAPIDVSNVSTASLNGLNSLTSATGTSRILPGQPTPGAAPTFSAPTPVPALAGVPFRPQPSMTSTPVKPGQPQAAPAQLTPAFTPITQTQGVVANTGGDGVYLRRTPHLADRLVAWPDNTPLQILGPEAVGDGQHWAQVRDPRGDVGWVPIQYVRH